jgi:predicted RND superfamily exporter protein
VYTRPPGEDLAGARELLGAWLRGAGEILSGHPASRRRARRSARPQVRERMRRPVDLTGVTARLMDHPARVLAPAAALALAGWLAGTTIPVQTDITSLVGGGTPALRDLSTLERVSGVSGEIDVTVAGADLATPRTVAWMAAYERRMLAHFGYRGPRGCAGATLCPALSLSDLFTDGAGRLGATARSHRSIEQVLAAIPPYFTRSVISADRRRAVLAFGVRLRPLASQERVISYMRAGLRPPAGVRAELAGLPVLAADAGAALASPARRLLTSLAGLAAVALALLVALRDVRRALVPLVPIALAGGWSALVLFLIGIPLDPMSAMLGVLVIAISTEFSVLLSERYRQERMAGLGQAAALGTAYRLTGTAVLASALTVIAGFGVLLLSDISMLRNFGFVTVIDMSVSLAGVVLVLPAVITLSERPIAARRGAARVRRADRRRAPATVA